MTSQRLALIPGSGRLVRYGRLVGFTTAPVYPVEQLIQAASPAVFEELAALVAAEGPELPAFVVLDLATARAFLYGHITVEAPTGPVASGNAATWTDAVFDGVAQLVCGAGRGAPAPGTDLVQGCVPAGGFVLDRDPAPATAAVGALPYGTDWDPWADPVGVDLTKLGRPVPVPSPPAPPRPGPASAPPADTITPPRAEPVLFPDAPPRAEPVPFPPTPPPGLPGLPVAPVRAGPGAPPVDNPAETLLAPPGDRGPWPDLDVATAVSRPGPPVFPPPEPVPPVSGETLPQIRYVDEVDVGAAPSARAVRVICDDGHTVEVTSGAIIGRNPTRTGLPAGYVAIAVQGGQVSRRHWELIVSPGAIMVRDLGSVLGTRIQLPGARQPSTIAGTRPAVVLPGTLVHFADRWILVEG